MDNEIIDSERYFTIFAQLEKDRKETPILNINSKVLIIDFLNMYLRAWTGSPAMNADGAHIGGMTGFLYSMGNAIRLTQATRCIIVADGEGGSPVLGASVFKEIQAGPSPGSVPPSRPAGAGVIASDPAPGPAVALHELVGIVRPPGAGRVELTV